MATTLQLLARWARDLCPADLPPTIRERVLLQHVASAAVVRSVAGQPFLAQLRKAGGVRGAALVVGGGSAPRRAAVRTHALLLSLEHADPHGLGGRPGAGSVVGAWAHSKACTLDEMLCATAAGDEIGLRLGASLLLGPDPDPSVVASAGAAIAIGWLEGLDADALAHALALALAASTAGSASGGLSDGAAATRAACVVAAADAVDLARAGVHGPIDLLDGTSFLEARSYVPLRAAFTGLGRVWLTQTLALPNRPGHPFIAPAVEGIAEILRRHLKAADRRLRPDQIEAVELQLGAPGFAMSRVASRFPGWSAAKVAHCPRRATAVQLLSHDLAPGQLSAEWFDSNKDRLGTLAAKVRVEHDWSRTLQLVDHLTTAAAPLFTGLRLAELRVAGSRAAADWGGALDRPSGLALFELLKARPDRLLERVQYGSGDMADLRVDELQFRYDAHVRLFTIRGGSWPERRDIPENSPGWPWEATVSAVHAGFDAVAGDGAAAPLLGLAGSTPAQEFVTGLLG